MNYHTVGLHVWYLTSECYRLIWWLWLVSAVSGLQQHWEVLFSSVTSVTLKSIRVLNYTFKVKCSIEAYGETGERKEPLRPVLFCVLFLLIRGLIGLFIYHLHQKPHGIVGSLSVLPHGLRLSLKLYLNKVLFYYSNTYIHVLTCLTCVTCCSQWLGNTLQTQTLQSYYWKGPKTFMSIVPL